MKTAVFSSLLFVVVLSAGVHSFAQDAFGHNRAEQCQQNIHFCECKSKFGSHGVYLTFIDARSGIEVSSRMIGNSLYSGNSEKELCQADMESLSICR